MIVFIVVSTHQRSLSPDKIAAHMNELLTHDEVTSVTVSDGAGATMNWSANG